MKGARYYDTYSLQKFNDDGTTEKCLLLLFKDQEHKSLLGQNYVYLRKGDTISIK